MVRKLLILLLLAGIGLYTTVANGIWYLYPVGLGKPLPYPSIADGVYLVGYLLELAGFVAFIRAHAGRSDRTALLDTALITIGVGILSWDLLMQPYIQLHGLSLVARVVSMAYPAVDILPVADLHDAVHVHKGLLRGRREITGDAVSSFDTCRIVFQPRAEHLVACVAINELHSAAVLHPV